MEASGRPVILLTEQLKEEEIAEIRAIVPLARLLTGIDLEADPSLVEQVEVCCPMLPAELWPMARSLRWLHIDRAGVESVLSIPEAKNHPAVITNTHIHANAVAEHLWGMALALSRNINRAVLQQREHAWDRKSAAPGISLFAGKTACIVGLGTIGRRCAELAKAFGMRVIGIRRRPESAGDGDARRSTGADEIVGPADRRSAFARSRLIMAILPDAPGTRHFIGREEMASMRGAYLLNAGRGSCVDTDALVEALGSGSVRAAGLDVTDPEPLPPEHPLWGMPNVIITPHYAGDHPGYVGEAFRAFIDNLNRYTNGEPLLSVVDREAGY
jgi:phosphoglycerate dehydrogenase-like enzyme